MYRYLTIGGFLSGYDLPKFPLYAIGPGEGKTDSFLQRTRFLAISEFGGRSLICHEGSAYRVMKVKLPSDVRTGGGLELANKDIFIFSNVDAAPTDQIAVHDGLLLSGQWDAISDRGLVAFDYESAPKASSALTETARAALQWQNPLPLIDKHRRRLA